MVKKRTCVFISGQGSNLKNLINGVGIDHDARAMEKPSDHCPIWLELDE